uniref:F-box domain-containing protein n=1 Tax=Ditylenchus dipsaci TaxID=166011 RepID=A0A915EF57_9BILA
MAITIPADIWLEVLTYLGARGVKKLILLSNLAFSRLIAYHANKVEFWKYSEQNAYLLQQTVATIANLNLVGAGYGLTSPSPSFYCSGIVGTGIEFQVPSGMIVRIVNSNSNVDWVLIGEQTLVAGNHQDLSLQLKNISGTNIQIPRQIFLSPFNAAATDSVHQNQTLVPPEVGSLRHCSAVDLTNSVVLATMDIPVQDNVLKTLPTLSNGSIGILGGFNCFQVSKSVFVVPRVFQNDLPSPMLVSVVNSSEIDVRYYLLFFKFNVV